MLVVLFFPSFFVIRRNRKRKRRRVGEMVRAINESNRKYELINMEYNYATYIYTMIGWAYSVKKIAVQLF